MYYDTKAEAWHNTRATLPDRIGQTMGVKNADEATLIKLGIIPAVVDPVEVGMVASGGYTVEITDGTAHKIYNGRTTEAMEAEIANAETTRQEAKSLALKAVENNFLALCDSLTSTTSHTKLTFAQIAAIGDAMTDQALHISIAIQLLSIDAEGKTIGGLSWWYDCAWHPEIIEAE